MNIAATLDKALRANGLAIVGVSIGDATDRSTWKVQPATLQGAAQSIIDSLSLTPPVTRVIPAPGSYLGALDADPDAPRDGDLWLLRETTPRARRILKFRDGDVTRTLTALTV